MIPIQKQNSSRTCSNAQSGARALLVDERWVTCRRVLLVIVAALLLTSVAVAGTSDAKDAARWVISDLGTLPSWPISEAVAINERGQIVGTSRREFGDDNQFVECHAVLWLNRRMTDISTNVGAPGCWVDLNDRGHIATNGGAHAFLWQDGKVTALGALPGRTTSSVRAINNRGQIIGDSWVGSPAFIWHNGTMRNLGSLGGGATSPFAINERGWVVGNSQTKGGDNHAFLWRNGRMTDLGTLRERYSYAVDLNIRGQVVGYSEVKQFAVEHAFLWEAGKLRDLGVLPRRPYSKAVAINDRGQIVGSSSDANGRAHAFLWQNGRMIDLGTLGGCCSTPAAINEQGQIVGESSVKGGGVHAFLWQNGKMTDLGTLGGAWSRALAINERGQIVGQSKPRKGRERAVLWTMRGR